MIGVAKHNILVSHPIVFQMIRVGKIQQFILPYNGFFPT
jgi:hypothetical protein